ncbi:MAG: hypothetical protein GKR94_11550 [Gammaproteobacteria bacterium]|nr:hypothetical protein [Gammaproteobacteria bacterium]
MFRTISFASRALATAGAGVTLLFASASFAGDKTAKDLRSVILLQGHSCPAVSQYGKNGNNDYTVNCDNGAGYRVKADGGRVAVTKL